MVIIWFVFASFSVQSRGVREHCKKKTHVWSMPHEGLAHHTSLVVVAFFLAGVRTMAALVNIARVRTTLPTVIKCLRVYLLTYPLK